MLGLGCICTVRWMKCEILLFCLYMVVDIFEWVLVGRSDLCYLFTHEHR